VISDVNRMFDGVRPCGTQHRVLAHDRALTDLNTRRFGIKYRAIHDTTTRSDANVAYESGSGCDERRMVDLGFVVSMPDQHV
jgi:hypothetical protein